LSNDVSGWLQVYLKPLRGTCRQQSKRGAANFAGHLLLPLASLGRSLICAAGSIDAREIQLAD
jgi:hypothetical protein